ncbi:MAG TPA: G8 domain-containing protein, partial [Gemmataceae bacterium]|nr:G8 domain-containing protein [Gemmataceae bacterium]
MARSLLSIAIAFLFSAAWCPGTRADHGQTPVADDPHGEHATALAMLPEKDATHRARESGDWSDPATWDNGVPTAGARAVIPEGVTVKLREELEPALDWIRVAGTLRFGATVNTRLRVATVLVTPTGRLQVGTAAERVRSDRMAQIRFVPRPEQHRANDPYDLSGGLIALGRVELYGSEYRGFAAPTEPLRHGTRKLSFDESPRGWKLGDELLFPASAAGGRDELRTIADISADSKSFTLSAPLADDHLAPAGVVSRIPVGNLTRNIVLASEDTSATSHRAHVMLMSHAGMNLSGVAFRGLGRTETSRIHTLPEKKPDGTVDVGDNLIGRYAVHFHLRSGASLKNEPHRFAGNVIVDSPKHGLVNHGGYVVAENNVTYAIHGSHFFAENGSEIGAFRNNLAVYSRGSGDKIRARECLFDFGHGGYGFWTQSPAVVMDGNRAFHHADAGFSIFPRPVKEFGQLVRFDRANLPAEVRDCGEGDRVSPGMIPCRFERNVAGNCGKGLEVWNVNTYAHHNVASVIAACEFWDTPDAGIEMPYTFHTIIRDTVVQGTRSPSVGIHLNSATKFLTLKRVSVSGFAVGFEVPV